MSCCFIFDFTKYKSKCNLCDTKILIPLFWGEGTVSHCKSVIGLRIHPEVSFPWRVSQCHHREREQQPFFPSAVPVSNETLFLPRFLAYLALYFTLTTFLLGFVCFP